MPSGVRMDKRVLMTMIREAPGQVENALDAAAFDGEAFVKRSFGTSPSAAGDAPGVITGALRASIHVEKPAQFKRYIIAATEYAAFLEFGTVKMAARPFMAPMAYYLEKNIEYYFRLFAK